jgi:protein transport protein SEC24
MPEYFCNLDPNQLRLDSFERPELNKGTVDIVVGPDYYASHPTPRIVPSYVSPEPLSSSTSSPLPTSTSFTTTQTQPTRPPEPMRILFLIDVSREAVECGLVKAACQAIQGVLYGGELDDGTRMESCVSVGISIGIVTYDTTVHFYDISVRLKFIESRCDV